MQGPGGIQDHMAPGTLHLSLSTVSPQIASRLEAEHRKRDCFFLSAPVMGRPDSIASKTFGFLLAGDPGAKEKARPLLLAMGASQVFDFGDQAFRANIAKLGINFMIASSLEILSEVRALLEGAGLDFGEFYKMATHTLFHSPVFLNYGRILMEKKFEPAQFSARLGLKDMNLVGDLARSAGLELPLAGILKEKLQQVIDLGLGESDWSLFTDSSHKADKRSQSGPRGSLNQEGRLAD